MAGMGPAPKNPGQRRRRNATVAMTQLPAEGRTGRPPKFPLPEDMVTAAKLRVAREQAEDLAEAQACGKPIDEWKLIRLQEKVALYEHVVAIQRKTELALWRELWKLPQAVAWERTGYTREVAKYVRLTVLAESGDLNAGKEARQWSDRLGLNDLALLRLRWEVARDEVAQQRQNNAPAGPPARPRLKAVDPGAVAGP